MKNLYFPFLLCCFLQGITLFAQQGEKGKAGGKLQDQIKNIKENSADTTLIRDVKSIAKDIKVDSEQLKNSAKELPLYPLADVTRTYYDNVNETVIPELVQQHLRDRVSYVEVTDENGPDKSVTSYSYDVHGNVKSLLQEIPGLESKRTDYAYDLISGKVNYVFYQYGKADQFIHKYSYDADNRVETACAPSDAYISNLEASYKYYAHGPLARTELGNYRVQGQDYYYTLQGWIKGVNMPFAGDPGADGISPSKVGKDVYAYTLGYYQNDYKASNSSVVLSDTRDQLWTRYTSVMGAANTGLHNGNIAWMVTDLLKIGEVNSNPAKSMQAMLYKYDQAHRIKKSYSLTNYTAGTGFGSRTAATPEAYDQQYTYDANGNILTQKRYDALAAVADDLNYQYYPNTNKLRYLNPVTTDLNISSGAVAPDPTVYRNITLSGTANVRSGATVELVAGNSITLSPNSQVSLGATFTMRMSGEMDGHYIYDKIGNLIRDAEEEVTIEWTPYGKVREVKKINSTDITSFLYDAAGNRVYKKMVRTGVTTLTHYVRDAGGNVMAVYTDNVMVEQPVYGSSRLGHYKGGVAEGKLTLGKRNYELSNHLGNILAVVTDNVGMQAANVWAKVTNTSDYYAFGLEMSSRVYNDPTGYRYGFNGKEKDKQQEFGATSYDYGFRIYNPRIAKFLSVDPLTRKFPWYTPYQFAGNMPIWAVDIDGLEPAFTNEGVKTMIIVIQGYKPARDTQLYRTQAENHPGASVDYDELSRIAEVAKDNCEIQVVVFSSSQNELTKRDVKTTLEDFSKKNPNGTTILIGHSLGADNLIEFVNENEDLEVDLLMTLETLDEWTDTNIPPNVKTVINFSTPNGKGAVVEIEDPEKTQGLNLSVPNSSHTSIDGDLGEIVSDIAMQKHKKASSDKLFKTATEGANNIPKKD